MQETHFEQSKLLRTTHNDIKESLPDIKKYEFARSVVKTDKKIFSNNISSLNANVSKLEAELLKEPNSGRSEHYYEENHIPVNTDMILLHRESINPHQFHRSVKPKINNLQIDGVQIGEHKLVFDAEIRQPSLNAEKQNNNDKRVSTLQHRLSHIEKDHRELSRRCSKQRESQTRQMQLTSLVLNEMEKRLQQLLEFWEEKETLWHKFINREHKLVSSINDKNDCEKHIASPEAAEKIEENSLAEISKITELDEQLQLALQKYELLLTTYNNLKEESDSSLEQHQKEMEKLVDDKNKITKEFDYTYYELEKSKTENENLKTRIANNNLLVEQCRNFVRAICQPQFEVVKDSSLALVERNRSTPDGFVLVPLITLLQGYLLLPPNERHDVIQKYEQKIKEVVIEANVTI